jgi:hypothetical protein
MPKTPRKLRKRPARTHYSIPELAAMVGVDRSAIWRKKKAGKIRTERVLDREMVPVAEMVRLGLLEESTT